MKEVYKIVAAIWLFILWLAILAALTTDSEAAGEADAVQGIEHMAGFDGELLASLPVICTTGTEYELMVHVVMAEAEGEPLEGKVAVANVVINRVRNRNQSVSEVIFSPFQFCTGSRFSLEPTQECREAVDMALRGHEAVGREVEYFCKKSVAFKDLTYVTSIGSHDFYKEADNER